jgi:S1-C subfamily serine protease
MAVAVAIAVVIPAVAGSLSAPPASRQHPASAWCIHLLANVLPPVLTGPVASTQHPANTGCIHVPANVSPPDPAVAHAAGVERARSSVVKIVGTAPSCSRTLEGSGFVFAPQHVLTNAHVVAGVRGGVTVTGRRHSFRGTVVLYDPERDIAVLYVPGLRVRPLVFASPPNQGDSAIVAGYPLNERFTAVPARIGGEQSANSPDLYQAHTVTRDIYAIRAAVRPGNSGGPLLAPNGSVDGVVLAAAVDLNDTGYALTGGEVTSDVTAGRAATAQVSTQGCD